MVMNDAGSNWVKEHLCGLRKVFPSQLYGDATLVNADCFEVLRHLPDNSIDSAVIDGPYGWSLMDNGWDNFNPKGIAKGVRRKGGAGISPSMFSGKYDLTRRGLARFQQFSYEWGVELLRVLKPGAHVVSFCAPRTYHRMATGVEDAGFEVRDQLQWLCGSGLPKSHNVGRGIDELAGAKRKIVGPNPNRAGRRNWDNNPKNITVPATEEAKYWDGWGTALKPSNEPILLARKPLSESSVARNVLRFGTGGINIDACRHGDKRRYPSNTIISEDVAVLLGDKATFFFCPKVSRKERNAGCEHLPRRPQNTSTKQRTYNDYCAVCGKRFIGSEKSRCHCPTGVKKTDKSVYRNHNNHPTVKPIALMEYLVKLVTPPHGICIDIFMGTGGTAVACSNLGFGFIGIEREKQWYEIAKARVNYWQNVKKAA